MVPAHVDESGDLSARCGTMPPLAAVALGVDALTALLTWSMQKRSMNIRALFLHNLSDALASVAVILGGTLIVLYDLRFVDPAITIAIAGYVLWLAFREIGGPIRILMLGAPEGIDGEAVIAALCRVDGVVDVHHVHLWQMQEHEAALDTHVVLEPDAWARVEAVKAAIKGRLRDDFGIAHSTLEFEDAEGAHREAALFGHGAGPST